MAKISVPVQLSQDTHVRDYLTLLNGILKLTPVELDVLAAFVEYDPFICASKAARKVVVEKLGMKNVAVLNNYVKSLKDKGCIYKDRTGLYRYNPIVSPREDVESIEFVLKPNDRSNLSLPERD